ncbi:hypothetical protein CVT24_008603 [Panaeolus cyanescens]|uniref:Uncharacterized protein n=1 Tax=Panaeolus cyanescens TaxID=181874 RepID=A0A409VEU0_9AGAR|nr:hypothetical protein CVT24_008603 [Panaeolus cyanescens]
MAEIKDTHNCVVEPNPLESLTLAERRLHNASIPISRLNPDVLSTIFELLAEAWPTEYIDQNSDSDFNCLVELNWATVSHVCHHWRNVAIANAPLWSDIDMESPKWAQLQLDRCGGSSISLCSEGSFYPTEEEKLLLRFAMTSKFAQMKSMSIYIRDEETLQLLVDTMCNPNISAPQLEELFLVGLCSRVVNLRTSNGEIPTFIDLLLRGGSPRLRRLDLAFFNFSWSSLAFTGLTTLMLNTGRLPQGQRFLRPLVGAGTFADMLNALQRMPGLEVLVLVVPLPDARYVPYGRVVELPRLKKFTISGDCFTSEALLRCLAFPPDAAIELDCTDSVEDPTPSALKRWFSAIHSVRLQDQRVIYPLFNSSNGAYLFDKIRIQKHHNYVTGTEFNIEFRLMFPSITPELTHWSITFSGQDLHFATFFSSLSLEKVESVDLDISMDTAPVFFGSLSSSLPSLSSMRLRELKSVIPFALFTRMNEFNPLTRQRTPNVAHQFPRLSALSFDGINFRVVSGNEDKWGALHKTWLLLFLYNRSAYMKPIRNLVFQGSYGSMSPRKLEELKCLVPFVEEIISDENMDSVSNSGYN